MPLLSMKRVLAVARQGGWAVAAFNPVDYASMKAIIQAAAEAEAPVIVQTSAKTVKYYGHEAIVGWARELAGAVSVPVSLHLDHGKDLKLLERCIETGWTDVMIDASDKPFIENLTLTKQVLEKAARRDVGVEAEVGEIGGVEEDIVADHGRHADAAQALEFCREAPGLAVFAPAIGTAHGVYKSEPSIEWDVLTQINAGTPLPFALHGGTGLPDVIIQRAIRLGCSKVNISTNLKHVFIDSFVEHHQRHPEEYEPLKVLEAQYAAMKELVLEKIRQFGGAGRAAEVKA
ncbi:MAG: class II fructose-bisphosphate aldolase [Verrucomicrobium sp.]|nr:class II fructose-bisphosphate aldolase [Verrucomicrobium sp.]